MIKYTIILCAVLGGIACSKEPATDKILTNFTIVRPVLPADGQSTTSVSVQLSGRVSSDRRNIIFSASSGVFAGTGTRKQTVTAEFVNGVLTATATFRSSTSPGTVTIEVKPEFDSPIREFILSKTIETTISTPYKILLERSASGIPSNHLGEVTITGRLLNADGKFVSRGYQVLFEDLAGTVRADGQFRSLQTQTGDSATVSGIYSAAAYPIGTQIKIRATVLAGGLPTTVKDSVFLTINQ